MLEEAEEGDELVGVEFRDVDGEDEVEDLVDLEALSDVGAELGVVGL